MKAYDGIGKEAAALENEQKARNNYEVTFD